ncbi:hypothetical protein MRY87_13155 [bacterium]|nr:hypothetical protein [bacterium]
MKDLSFYPDGMLEGFTEAFRVMMESSDSKPYFLLPRAVIYDEADPDHLLYLVTKIAPITPLEKAAETHPVAEVVQAFLDCWRGVTLLKQDGVLIHDLDVASNLCIHAESRRGIISDIDTICLPETERVHAAKGQYLPPSRQEDPDRMAPIEEWEIIHECAQGARSLIAALESKHTADKLSDQDQEELHKLHTIAHVTEELYRTQNTKALSALGQRLQEALHPLEAA